MAVMQEDTIGNMLKMRRQCYDSIGENLSDWASKLWENHLKYNNDWNEVDNHAESLWY